MKLRFQFDLLIFINIKSMERQIHRLQQVIQSKVQEVNQLTKRNKDLEKQLKNSADQIRMLKDQAQQHFSYKYVPDRQILKTLQAKLASSTWQIHQLSRTNEIYQENIIKLQSQLITYQQQIGIKKYQFQQTFSSHQQFIEENNNAHLMKEWENLIKQKEALIDQNFALKNKLKSIEAQRTQKMSFYLNQVMSLSIKIKNQHQTEKAKLGEFQNLVKQLKKQNQQLRQTLHIKNEQLMMFYDQLKLITPEKSSEIHTIKNLRKQLERKGQQFFNVLQKLREVEQLKKILKQQKDNCSQSLVSFNQLAEKYQKSGKQIGKLKQQLHQSQQQVQNLQKLIHEDNKKLQQILIQNQVCHELLFETRGFTDLYTKDVQRKLQLFFKNLQKRRQNSQSWRTVSQLISVNQKLRMIYNYQQKVF